MIENNFPALNKLLLMVIFSISSLSAIRYKRARYFLFLFMIFLSAFDWGVSLSFTPFSLAAAAAFVLLITDYNGTYRMLIALRKQRLFGVLITLPVYMFISALLITPNGSLYHAYFSVQWLLLLFAYAAFYYNASYKMLEFAKYVIIISFAINLTNYLPVLFNLHNWPLIFKTTPSHFYASRFGAFLSPFIALAYRREMDALKRSILLACLITIMLITLLSGGRAQTVGMIVVIAIVLRKGTIRILSVLAIITIGLYSSNSVDFEAAISRYEAVIYTDADSPVEIEFRKKNTCIAFNGFLESPMIGQGFGSWIEYSSKYLDQRIAVHNSYMHILVELGLFGSCLYLIMIYKLLRSRKKDSHKYVYSEEAYIAMLLIIALSIIGIAHSIIVITYYAPLFFGMRAGAVCRQCNENTLVKCSNCD